MLHPHYLDLKKCYSVFDVSTSHSRTVAVGVFPTSAFLPIWRTALVIALLSSYQIVEQSLLECYITTLGGKNVNVVFLTQRGYFVELWVVRTEPGCRELYVRAPLNSAESTLCEPYRQDGHCCPLIRFHLS